MSACPECSAVDGQPCRGVYGRVSWVHSSRLMAAEQGDCDSPLHDHPLPSGYTEADDEARRRLRRKWQNPRCRDCGLYGWVAPSPEEVPPAQPILARKNWTVTE